MSRVLRNVGDDPNAADLGSSRPYEYRPRSSGGYSRRALIRQRRADQVAADNATAAELLGAEVGRLVVQGDRRADELLVLKRKVTTLTSWLVFLTVVIILLGVGSIIATVAAG